MMHILIRKEAPPRGVVLLRYSDPKNYFFMACLLYTSDAADEL